MTNSPDCTQTSEPCSLQRENEVDKDNIQGDGNDNEKVNDEEDEDADFNPFLNDTNSVEVSSSLSSEVEDLEMDNSHRRGKSSAAFEENSIERCIDIMHTGGIVERGEELLMQTTVPPGGVCGNKSNILSIERESLLTSQSENEQLCDKDNDLTTTTYVSNAAGSRKTQLDMDTDGAICMRTRARYSLASFTLDELETFLQETDDEDDLQNVDDEEEYKKFLAAVLRGDDFLNPQESTNADDEDEENDADFELELEEALESEPEEVEERRMTRRNRRQKASIENSMKLSGQFTRPLRPLLPFTSLGSFPAFDCQHLPTNISQSHMPPVSNGFTPHQIGQLHCLIHEHVQLLIQVFSVSVLEPLKHHIAAQVRELILELVRKREQLLAWRTMPYPSFCFSPPYIHPSVSGEVHKVLPLEWSKNNQQHDFPSGSNRELHSDVTSLPNSHTNLADEQAGSSRAAECSSWVPYICGPVQSVIDVAPLRLVENYMDDVSSAVQAHEQHQIEQGFGTHCQKEPLFPLDSSSCNSESDGQGEMEDTPPNSTGMLLSSSSQKKDKKTMAATLLEKAKNQSTALVPKEISELAQRFRPLFNPTLYPHKPPLASHAKRVLFTDAEDELLALGLMEYNTDWKAIQQRFLPCKSRHQIFVRQKNRASSKAPENPIKAVRRMKNSPLTSEEIARIELGLKKFKLDWISIWTFFVPYRDPSLLPRQWRIACGTQKSYKSDGNKKAKRHLYELRRKASKSSPSYKSDGNKKPKRHSYELRRKASKSSSNWHLSSEKEGDSTDNAAEDTNCGDKLMDKEDEAYVHEAFLADWRPENNDSTSSPTFLHSGGSQTRQQIEYSGCASPQPLVTSKSPAALRSSYSQIVMRPYRARRSNNARLVKLSPDLPPVNLPPSVRVMSQSAFQSSQGIAATKVPGNALRVGAVGPSKNKPMVIPASSQQPPNHLDTSVDNCTSGRVDADLQMHPLLFQAPLEGHLPYYQPNSSAAISTFSSFTFFSGRQPQLSLSLFHNPRDIRDAVHFLSKSSKTSGKNTSSSSGDFHPLLQTTHDMVMNSTGMHPVSARVPSRAKSRQKNALNGNPCESISNQALNGGPSASTTKHASNAGKVTDIDLDIHPNFTSADQEAVGSRDMAAPSTGTSSTVAIPVTIESESARDSSNMRDSAPDGHGIDDELNSNDFALITSRNDGGRKVSDDVRDDSFPEIIMEQEELSDSEEEFGENVEFEQEEMADSDGDSSSDSQQFVSIPDEEVHQDEVGADIDDSRIVNASKYRGRTGSKSDGQSNGIEASAKVANIKPNAESLKLNSCPQTSPRTNLKKPMVGDGPFGPIGTVGLNQLPSSSKRSSRHSKLNTASSCQMLKRVEDPQEHQNPSSAGEALPRNPRKRRCRSNSNSGTSSPNTGMDVQHFKSARTDEFG